MQQEYILNKNKQKFSARLNNIPVALLIILAFAVYMTVSSSFKAFLFTSPLFVLWIVYLLFVAKTVLYRVFFDTQGRQVNIEILKFSKLKRRYTIPFDSAQIVMRQDLFGSRHNPQPWVLKIYSKSKLIYKQGEDNGWTTPELFEIEKAAKFFTSAN